MAVLVMPQLGETVTEGTVVRWLKQPGDPVAVDEAVYEVSTEKVDTEVTSAVAGILGEHLVAEGATVPIGTPVAEVVVAGEGPGPRPAPAPAPAARITPAPRGARAPSVATVAGREPWDVAPVVRREARRRGVDLSDVAGTGQGGRITLDDVKAAAPQAEPAAPPLELAADVEPFPPVRARAMPALVRANAAAVPALLVTDADHSAIEAARTGTGITALAFVARAVIDALDRFPRLNASVTEAGLRHHAHVNLGIAVDLDHDGLVVVVVHQAETLRLRALAAAIRDLAARARAGKLQPRDLSDATFTITNVGPRGTTVAFPLVPVPQVAILSTGAVRMTPVAVADGAGGWQIAVRPVSQLSLGFDHRAVDGDEAAELLATIRESIEHRDWRAEVG